MVRLQEITEDNFAECVKLTVKEEQKAFVASNLYSLAQAWLYHTIAQRITCIEVLDFYRLVKWMMTGKLLWRCQSNMAHDAHRASRLYSSIIFRDS